MYKYISLKLILLWSTHNYIKRILFSPFWIPFCLWQFFVSYKPKYIGIKFKNVLCNSDDSQFGVVFANISGWFVPFNGDGVTDMAHRPRTSYNCWKCNCATISIGWHQYAVVKYLFRIVFAIEYSYLRINSKNMCFLDAF